MNNETFNRISLGLGKEFLIFARSCLLWQDTSLYVSKTLSMLLSSSMERYSKFNSINIDFQSQQKVCFNRKQHSMWKLCQSFFPSLTVSHIDALRDQAERTKQIKIIHGSELKVERSDIFHPSRFSLCFCTILSFLCVRLLYRFLFTTFSLNYIDNISFLEVRSCITIVDSAVCYGIRVSFFSLFTSTLLSSTNNSNSVRAIWPNNLITMLMQSPSGNRVGSDFILAWHSHPTTSLSAHFGEPSPWSKLV